MNNDLRTKALEACQKIAEGLEILKAVLATQPTPEVKRDPKKKASVDTKYPTAISLSADKLGVTPDIDDEAWPVAVPPHMIVSTTDPLVKQFRAVQVIGIMGLPTSGLKVLDFGCGDGFISNELANTASHVVGFDIRRDDNWDAHKCTNLTFTTDKNVVVENGPYDLILGYDVIDHIEGQDLESVFLFIRSVLSSKGRAFIRCHPWTSKHGSHLYSKLNKAYAHLVLTPDELAQRGYIAEYNMKIVRPLACYDSLLTKSGFNIISRKGHVDTIDSFFDGPLLDRINKVAYQGKADRDTILKIMGLQFIDYHFDKPAD